MIQHGIDRGCGWLVPGGCGGLLAGARGSAAYGGGHRRGLHPRSDRIEQDVADGEFTVPAVGSLDHVPGRRGGIRTTERALRHLGEGVEALEMLPVARSDASRFFETLEPF